MPLHCCVGYGGVTDEWNLLPWECLTLLSLFARGRAGSRSYLNWTQLDGSSTKRERCAALAEVASSSFYLLDAGSA